MQTERYIFFVAVAFTLKITLTDRAHMSHQTLIRVLRPLPMRAPSPQHPKRTISFHRGNLILARGRSSVMPETRTHSELWCESGPVSFGVSPECTAAPARCFSTSPSHLALPGESCPLSQVRFRLCYCFLFLLLLPSFSLWLCQGHDNCTFCFYVRRDVCAWWGCVMCFSRLRGTARWHDVQAVHTC